MTNKPYGERTAEDYLQYMEPNVLSGLNARQVGEFKRLLELAIPKPAPKIVDLRIALDLIITKYYIVVFVGKDRRKQPRRYSVTPVTRVGNTIVACLLLLALNLGVTVSLFLAAYLMKSAAGINLLPGHLQDYVESDA